MEGAVLLSLFSTILGIELDGFGIMIGQLLSWLELLMIMIMTVTNLKELNYNRLVFQRVRFIFVISFLNLA